MLFPGGEEVVKATSYENDKKGVATEDAKEIAAMQKKRIRKHEKLKEELKDMETVKVHKEGSTALVFWGSTKGAILEAAKDLDVKLVQIMVAQPFPEEKLKKNLEGSQKVISVEQNSTGQMSKVLRENGINVDEKILKHDGRPFFVEELRREIEEKL